MRLRILDQDDRFHDECGVFGVFGHPEAANLAYLGIHALQHRGQESAGIASWDLTVKPYGKGKVVRQDERDELYRGHQQPPVRREYLY